MSSNELAAHFLKMETECISAEECAIIEMTETIYKQRRTMVCQPAALNANANDPYSGRGDVLDVPKATHNSHRYPNQNTMPASSSHQMVSKPLRYQPYQTRRSDEVSESRQTLFEERNKNGLKVATACSEVPRTSMSIVPTTGPELTTAPTLNLTLPRSILGQHVLPSITNFEEYQRLVLEFLDKSDLEFLGGKRIIKRSGWRKLALAFHVSFECRSEVIEKDQQGNVSFAHFCQRAIMPDGRFADGWGGCDSKEKRFSKPNHDVPATAETRAKNRACADLLGIGESKR